MGSELEETLAFQSMAAGLPRPEREYRFCTERRWRFDFAWPESNLACEVEGGTWSRGRHTRGAGFEKDCEKYNAATLDGWRVLRVTGKMITDGTALDAIEALIRTYYIWPAWSDDEWMGAISPELLREAEASVRLDGDTQYEEGTDDEG